MSRVALVQGDNRGRNVAAALAAIDDDIDVTGKERILLKPNFVSVYNPLAATHVDAMRAVIELLVARGAHNMTIAEGPATGTAAEGFQNYGYLPLIEEYGLRVVDLNKDAHVGVELLDSHLRPKTVQVSRTVLESDYRVSVGPPKTHDEVMVTASLKNYAVGSVVGKRTIHEGLQAINLNLYRLARATAPQLAVIDGFVGMEGEGPNRGTAVDWGIAVASTDPLAADCLTARMMGFDPHEVGYLHYCLAGGLGEGEPDQISVVGNAEPEQVTRHFQPHSSIERQRHWRVEGSERFL